MADLNSKVSAIDKLIDYAATGVGAIAGPMLAPWRASREAKARLASAQIDAEVRRIEAESDAGTSAIIAKAQAEARQYVLPPDADVRGAVQLTREDIVQRIDYQERKRLTNIKSAVEDAAEELGDKEVTDHEPDPDWTARYIDGVQDVSSEDLRKIWAKILAGEVESPGRTSLRTLETLRNMTKRDAEMFGEVCNFVLFKALYFIVHERRYTQQFDALQHFKLVHLQDCGLLHFGQSTQNITDETEQYVYQGLLLQVSRNIGGTARIPFQVATLTIAGSELYRIVEPESRWDYLRMFASILHSKNCRLSYSQIVNWRLDGGFKYVNSFTQIEPGSDDAKEFTP